MRFQCMPSQVGADQSSQIRLKLTIQAVPLDETLTDLGVIAVKRQMSAVRPWMPSLATKRLAMTWRRRREKMQQPLLGAASLLASVAIIIRAPRTNNAERLRPVRLRNVVDAGEEAFVPADITRGARQDTSTGTSSGRGS